MGDKKTVDDWIATDKESVRLWIDKHADKELTFGCSVRVPENDANYILGWHCGIKPESKHRKGDTFWLDRGKYKSQSGLIVETQQFVSLGHDIYIGDVLEKMQGEMFHSVAWDSVDQEVSNLDELARMWRKCGLTKSIQQIVQDSGYETVRTKNDPDGFKCSRCAGSGCEHCGGAGRVLQLKDENARNLLTFLMETIK